MTAPARVSIDPKLRTRSWRNAIFAVFVLAGLAFATWAARIPAVQADLGIPTAGVALLLFGMAAGSIAGLSLAPAILARLGPRRGIATCLYGIAAGLVIAGTGASILHSHAAVLAGLVVFGFAYSATDVLMNVEGAEVEKAVGKTIMPLMHAFFSLGTVAGAGLGTAASAAGIPPVWNLAAMAALLILAGTVAAGFLQAEAPPPALPVSARGNNASSRSSRALWKDSRLVLIGIMMLGMAFTEGAANDWIALATVEGHGYDPTTGALVYGVFVAAMTVGRVFGGPMIDRHGRVKVLLILAMFGMAGVLMFISAASPALTVTGAALWGLGGSLGFPVGMSAAAEHATDAARRVSFVATFGYGAFLVGPPVLGILGEQFGILIAFYLICPLLVLSAATAPAARTEKASPELRG